MHAPPQMTPFTKDKEIKKKLEEIKKNKKIEEDLKESRPASQLIRDIVIVEQIFWDIFVGSLKPSLPEVGAAKWGPRPEVGAAMAILEKTIKEALKQQSSGTLETSSQLMSTLLPLANAGQWNGRLAKAGQWKMSTESERVKDVEKILRGGMNTGTDGMPIGPPNAPVEVIPLASPAPVKISLASTEPIWVPGRSRSPGSPWTIPKSVISVFF